MIEHLAPYTVSPRDLIAGRSTWEGERHKTKMHAYVTRAGCVGPVHKTTVTTQLDDFSCNGIFANVIYTHSARDVRVHLSLVALPFPSRASGDKICGRYNIRRKVPNQESKAAGEVHGAPPKTLTINTTAQPTYRFVTGGTRVLRIECVFTVVLNFDKLKRPNI